ncbi:MAG: FAD-dependent oxidoreductase [Chloroflexi bacterium]|nr:FAD-dependent oxidoreductase [Chloroflexota bacterium]
MANESPYRRLFQPGNIGGLQLRNRVIMGIYPTKYAQDSQVTDRLLWFFRTRARGGAALIVVEGPCIDHPRDYTGGTQLRLDEDSFLPGLRNLTGAIHAEGAKAFTHLSFPPFLGGRSGRVSLVDQSTPADFGALAGKFGKAASQAREAGFDGVEVQAGWGHLLSRLLSPASNRRTDDYGGVLANRARFLLETVAAIRKATGADFPIQVKLAVKDYEPGGFDLEEAQAVAVMLEKAGVASILVTAGVGGKTRRWGQPPQALPEGVLAPLAAAIKGAVSIPVIAIGKIKHPQTAEDILAKGQADFIGLVRPLIADPDWPNKAAAGKAEDIRGCSTCLHDCVGGVPELDRACTVNPYTGREGQIKIEPAAKRKKVVVVGGGPAGLQAAITAAERGHAVHILERDSSLGGVFASPIIQAYKSDVTELPRYLVHRAEQLGVKVTLKSKVDADTVLREQPDAVVIAMGSGFAIPRIPGLDDVKWVGARRIWAAPTDIKGKVAVIGGGSVGCETADLLADRGCQVTVLEMLPEILNDMQSVPKDELLGNLKQKQIAVVTNAKVTKVEAGRLLYQDAEGQEHEVPMDTLVVATGGRPNKKLGDELQAKVAEVLYAGDCDQPGTGGMAIRSGLAVGMKI